MKSSWKTLAHGGRCGVRRAWRSDQNRCSMALIAASSILIAAASCVSPGAAAQPGAGGPDKDASAAGTVLYVCNQDDGTISVLDVESGRLIRTVDLRELGFSGNARPHHVVVEPDGSHWYVSLIGEGKVVKLDRDDRVVGFAAFDTPGMLALDPAADRLYVGRSMTAVNPPPRIGAITRSGMDIEEIDVFFPRPHAMAVDQRTGIVYTASLGVNQIAAVDPATERAVLTDVPGPPHALMQFALSPDGRTLAISGELSHTVLFFDVSEDPLRPRATGGVDVASQPFDPVFTLDGGTLWLGNKGADRITAIDVSSREVLTVLEDPRIRQPHGAAASSDGRWILISNTNVREEHSMEGEDPAHGADSSHAAEGRSDPAEAGAGAAGPPGGRGSVAVIDAETRALVRVIEVGRNATGIAGGR